jgi:hypothetical protein
MIFFGHIVDGRVVFDEPLSLPDGTLVRIEVFGSTDTRPTLLERLGDVVGSAEGLPADAARNVDHYLYGHPKL